MKNTGVLISKKTFRVVDSQIKIDKGFASTTKLLHTDYLGYWVDYIKDICSVARIGCEGKSRYPTRKVAKKYGKRQSKKDSKVLKIYECVHCQYFHLTSETKENDPNYSHQFIFK